MSLDTDRRRRRKGAEEDDSVRLFKESDALWVYEDGGARDPSVLSFNKRSHIEARRG